MRAVLFLAAFAAGITIVVRTLIGPFDFPLRVTTPLNPEGWLGLAVTILLASGARYSAREEAPAARQRVWFAASIAFLAGITAAVFWRALRIYFLADDFVLVNLANNSHSAAPMFATPGGDGFFRPVGYLTLMWTSTWAGVNSTAWHITALALHALNVTLAFMLAARLSFSRMAAFFAAALFAIHGTRPEAVTWIAGRFDLVAVFFVLAGLLLFLTSYGQTVLASRLYLLASLVSMALGILSKESAFAFPFLAALILAARRERFSRKAAVLIPFFVTAAVLFAYRWSLLGGIGGYRNPRTGEAQALAVGLPTIKALALRLWTGVYFPINWSAEPGAWLKLTMITYICALVWLASGRPNRRLVAFSASFLAISALPALQGLAFGASLEGARLLYLPCLGFCFVIAAAVDGLGGRAQLIAASAVLLFQFAALEHNLNQWQRVSDSARAAAIRIAQCGAPAQRKLVDLGFPSRLNGIPFLGNVNSAQLASLRTQQTDRKRRRFRCLGQRATAAAVRRIGRRCSCSVVGQA